MTSSSVTGSVVSWPCTTWPIVSPTRSASMPAWSKMRANGWSYAVSMAIFSPRVFLRWNAGTVMRASGVFMSASRGSIRIERPDRFDFDQKALSRADCGRPTCGGLRPPGRPHRTSRLRSRSLWRSKLPGSIDADSLLTERLSAATPPCQRRPSRAGNGERVRERRELGLVERLAAALRVDAERGERIGGLRELALQRAAQLLAPLAERRTDQTAQHGDVGDTGRCRARREREEGRAHLRARRELLA